MRKQQPSKNRIPLGFAPFFEKALDVIKPPIMKFFVVLVVAVLLYLLLKGENITQNLGLVLLVVVVLICAFLVAALHYAEIRFRYARRTEEQLKSTLREVVLELQEEKMGSTASPGIKITYVEYDPPGDDLENEFARVENAGRTTTDMINWTLCDEANHRFTFPAFILRPGRYVRVWTKAGINTTTDLYWGRGQAAWNKAGDCAYLRDSTGTLIDTYRWSPGH